MLQLYSTAHSSQSYSQLAEGEALWSRALISLSKKQKQYILNAFFFSISNADLQIKGQNCVDNVIIRVVYTWELSVYLCSEFSLWWQNLKWQLKWWKKNIYIFFWLTAWKRAQCRLWSVIRVKLTVLLPFKLWRRVCAWALWNKVAK